MTGATGLLLIDIQTGFDAPDWGARCNPDAEAVAGGLLEAARFRGWCVYHVRHISDQSGSPLTAARGGIDFKPEVTPLPGEPIIENSVNSAFIGTGLETRLRQDGVTDLVIAGLTTPHCVSTTTRMAANLGFRARLPHDACAAFESNADMTWLPGASRMDAETAHRTALAHLSGEFARVAATDEILSA